MDLWADNVLVIYCEGNRGFSCTSSENMDGVLKVPKFSDILYRTYAFKSQLEDYTEKEYCPVNPFDLKTLEMLSEADPLLNLIFDQNLYFDRPLSKEQVLGILPLVKMLQNFNFDFYHDYKREYGILGNEIHFEIGGKKYNMNEDNTIATLFLKQDCEGFKAAISFGGELYIGSCESTFYGSLKRISDFIENFSKIDSESDIAKIEDVKIKRFHQVMYSADKENYQELCKICKVGLSDEVTKFRETSSGVSAGGSGRKSHGTKISNKVF